jgi:hypothetical protein
MQETPEELERITDELQHRVENWHGLDITRYAVLPLMFVLTRSDLESSSCTATSASAKTAERGRSWTVTSSPTC